MPVPRLHVPLPLAEGQLLLLPSGPARHVQVLRLQPGMPVVLFNGEGGEHEAVVHTMGRSDVQVQVGRPVAVDRELPVQVTLAVGMPANDRMDTVVEKATELGVTAIQPLVCERSVLRLAGERAAKRREHWQAIAVAAAEQCGRTAVPQVHAVQPLAGWLAQLPTVPGLRLLLSPGAAPQPLPTAVQGSVLTLSGPEGGLSAQEEALAAAHGFVPTQLGPRILRADTAPLAVMAWFALHRETQR